MQIKCSNCGSIRFIENEGVWECAYCGSRFVSTSVFGDDKKCDISEIDPELLRAQSEGLSTEARDERSTNEENKPFETEVFQTEKPHKKRSIIRTFVAVTFALSLVFIGLAVAGQVTAKNNTALANENEIVRETDSTEQEIEDLSKLGWQHKNSFEEAQDNTNSIDFQNENSPLELKSNVTRLSTITQGSRTVQQLSCVVQNNSSATLKNVEFKLNTIGDTNGFSITTLETLEPGNDYTIFFMVNGKNTTKVKLSYTVSGETHYLISDWVSL